MNCFEKNIRVLIALTLFSCLGLSAAIAAAVGAATEWHVIGAAASASDNHPVNKLKLEQGKILLMGDRDNILTVYAPSELRLTPMSADGNADISYGSLYGGGLLIDLAKKGSRVSLTFWDNEAAIQSGVGITKIMVQDDQAHIYCQEGDVEISYDGKNWKLPAGKGCTLFRRKPLRYIDYVPTANELNQIRQAVVDGRADANGADTPKIPDGVFDEETNPSNPSMVISGEQLP